MDFMVDLETMGSGPTSVVVQIGCVAFEIDTGEILHELLVNVNPQEEIENGFTIEGSTLTWWAEEAKKGHCTWTSGQMDCKTAWLRYANFIRGYGTRNSRVWSHSTFDAPIVTYHLNVLKLRQPVHFNRYLDLRTISVLARGRFSIPESQRPDDAHDALADCKYQVEWLCACWKELRK